MDYNKFAKRWANSARVYGAARYAYGTRNAKVKFVNDTYRDLLLVERVFTIGLGAALAPITAPIIVMHDITKLECKIKNIDLKDLGYNVKLERDNWWDYV